jgi:FkbM family methyltransferase
MTAAAVMLLARRTRYLEAEMLGLRRLVGPGSVCIDVGSAAGLYTLALSRLAGPSGRVHSVEPLSFAHPVWTRVLRARQARNVRHHAVALAAERGSGVMSVPVGRYGPVTGRSFLAGSCRGLGSNAEFADQIEVGVQVDTLDGLCARESLNRLDFIKVDVEGAELAVLEGGQRAIETFRPTMLIEIEARHTARYQYRPDDLAGWLAERGYTMHTWRHRWQETDRVRPHIRNYLFRAPPLSTRLPPSRGRQQARAARWRPPG